MKQRDGMVVALLGVIAGLLIVCIFQMQHTPSAAGQTAAAVSEKWLMATSTTAGGQAVVFLFDIENKRLGTYSMVGTEVMQLVGVRTVTQEFSVREYGKGMKPTWKQIEEDLKRAGGGAPKK